MTTSGRDEVRAPTQQETEDGHEAARRAVLRQIGRFAYAAPALALLAQPKRAQAGYGGGGGSRGGGDGGSRSGGDGDGVKRTRIAAPDRGKGK